MEIKLTDINQVQVVELDGRIDALNNSKFEVFLMQLTEKLEHNIVIDCNKLDFINSSGLRVLIMSLKKLKSAQKVLILCNLQKNIKEVFQYSGFDKLFEIHLNREEAIKKIN